MARVHKKRKRTADTIVLKDEIEELLGLKPKNRNLEPEVKKKRFILF